MELFKTSLGYRRAYNPVPSLQTGTMGWINLQTQVRDCTKFPLLSLLHRISANNYSEGI